MTVDLDGFTMETKKKSTILLGILNVETPVGVDTIRPEVNGRHGDLRFALEAGNEKVKFGKKEKWWLTQHQQ